MVQDSAQSRRRGAHDFLAYYEFTCARQESVPVPAVKMNLEKGMLDFNGDRLKLTDWPPILNSISINKHLHHIAISSTYQAGLGSGDVDRRYYKPSFRKKIPVIRSKDMTFKLCKALRECLTVSPNLKTLQLKGLPVRGRDLNVLTKGLSKSVSLENLSLAHCPISDEGLEVICQSVKYSANIRTVDFTGCSLTWRGAEHMANIIKHQAMQRHGTAWAESLRYRQPQFEGMGGLRRVTLNCNTLIGDRGAAALAQELTEDLWVKDKVLIKTIIEKVLMNTDGQSPEYCWIMPAATETQRAPMPKRLAVHSSVRGKATFRIAPHKRTSPGGPSSSVAQVQKPYSRCGYVPWRAAARAGRQRGLPPGVGVNDQSFQGATTVKVNMESDSEEEVDEEDVVVVGVEQRPSSPSFQGRMSERQFERMQMELKECRLRLAEERRARLKAESRLMEYELENARLRDANRERLSEAFATTGSASAPPAFGALDDEAVLESIENSFTKFHAFLDLLKDAGLGQLASIAGIDKSDFQPLERPQLSSTIRPQLDHSASLTRGEYDQVSPLVGSALPPLPVGPANTTITGSPPALRKSLCGHRLLDVPYTQAVGPAVKEGPAQYSKPDTRHDSGSECSFHSQKSFDNVSFGKTFQTQPENHNNTNSHQSSSRHSRGSHGYRFNNSSANSHASQGNRSHGGLTVRSSVSDIISDRAESVGSAWSRNREQGRLVTVGQSGSEGSEGKAYHGRDTLDQIRSLGSLGGQSDYESF
ncbi:centrosomal protein of 78 kDa isoform X2 [Mastacembelus armatus]|uniref:Centrosomal protein 78 n=1 Tax=Mastacembelus armatus TaxID=205130 RepID=A0A3Q3MK21_9TELE|nr:centrosomal protein of 78 kDa isoform X2 [Mastacembelus armatus]